MIQRYPDLPAGSTLASRRPKGVSIKRLTRTFALKKLVVTMQLAGIWSLREKTSISSSIP
jgi:hypothetical protein